MFFTVVFPKEFPITTWAFPCADFDYVRLIDFIQREFTSAKQPPCPFTLSYRDEDQTQMIIDSNETYNEWNKFTAVDNKRIYVDCINPIAPTTTNTTSESRRTSTTESEDDLILVNKDIEDVSITNKDVVVIPIIPLETVPVVNVPSAVVASVEKSTDPIVVDIVIASPSKQQYATGSIIQALWRSDPSQQFGTEWYLGQVEAFDPVQNCYIICYSKSQRLAVLPANAIRSYHAPMKFQIGQMVQIDQNGSGYITGVDVTQRTYSLLRMDTQDNIQESQLSAFGTKIMPNKFTTADGKYRETTVAVMNSQQQVIWEKVLTYNPINKQYCLESSVTKDLYWINESSIAGYHLPTLITAKGCATPAFTSALTEIFHRFAKTKCSYGGFGMTLNELEQYYYACKTTDDVVYSHRRMFYKYVAHYSAVGDGKVLVLLLQDFIQFYVESCENNLRAVWNDLFLQGYTGGVQLKTRQLKQGDVVDVRITPMKPEITLKLQVIQECANGQVKVARADGSIVIVAKNNVWLNGAHGSCHSCTPAAPRKCCCDDIIRFE